MSVIAGLVATYLTILIGIGGLIGICLFLEKVTERLPSPYDVFLFLVGLFSMSVLYVWYTLGVL